MGTASTTKGGLKMSDVDPTNTEDIDPVFDKAYRKCVRGGSDYQGTDLEIEAFWAPIEAATHVFDPTFIADQSGSTPSRVHTSRKKTPT